MNQISLNVLAISIFVLTFSVLLEPVLPYPPALPAAVTFGILVLATADTLAWESQGATLLLDWFERQSPEQQKRVARHEAGHFLVAYLLGIPIAGYALNAWEAFKQGQKAQGGVRFEDAELLSQLQKGKLGYDLLDKYCTVWMAGIAAETLAYGNAEGGAEDRAKLQAVLKAIKNSAMEDANTKARFHSLQARTLIESHQDAYEALVAALEKRSPVAECYQLLEEKIS